MLLCAACNVQSRASACIRVYSRALACVYVYPLDADCFQPGFHVFKKKVFFRVPSVHRVPCISRASCFLSHQNISACIYVHPRASTRITEGVVLDYSIKSKIALISVTICSLIFSYLSPFTIHFCFKLIRFTLFPLIFASSKFSRPLNFRAMIFCTFAPL